MFLIAKFYILNILFFFFFTIVGHLIRCFINNKIIYDIKNIFKSFFLGLVLSVSFYSLILSNFKTVNSIVLILILTYFFIKRKKIIKPKISNFKLYYFDLLLVIFFITISFGFFICIFFDKNFIISPTVFYDLHYYADLSKGLTNLGTENPIVRFYTFFCVKDYLPYHYFELWLNSFIAECSYQNHYHSFLLITFPLLLASVFIGTYSTLIFFFRNILFCFFLSILVPLSTVIAAISFVEWSNFQYFSHYAMNPTNAKLLILYLLFISISIYKYDSQFLILILLIVAIIYTSTMPAIFLGLLIFVIIDLIVHKNYSLYILPIVGVSLFFLYNFIFKSKELSYSNIIYTSDFLLLIKKIVVNSFKHLLGYVHIIIPITIIAIIELKQRKKISIYLQIIFFITFSAILIISFLDGSENYTQLISNIIPPLYLTTIIYTINYFKKSKIIITVFTIILIVISLANIIFHLSFAQNKAHFNYSASFINNCLNELQNCDKAKFIIFSNLEQDSRWTYDYYQIAPFTSLLENVSSSYNILSDTGNITQPFVKYKKDHSCLNDSIALNNYLIDEKITHIFTSSSKVIPNYIVKRLILVCSDFNTKHCLYKF